MPSVFVGFSREGIEVARAVQAQLVEVSDVDLALKFLVAISESAPGSP
jgi:hypothetical protein